MNAIANLDNLIVYLMQLRVDGQPVIPAVDDAHAVEKLKSLTGRQVVMAYPGIRVSGDYLAKVTSYITIHVLEKCLGPGRTEEKELEQYRGIAVTVCDIVRTMQSDSISCTLLSGFQFQNININPTYNIYGGWGGWMIEIEI